MNPLLSKLRATAANSPAAKVELKSKVKLALVIGITDADRENANNAVIINEYKYKLIKPIRGTIAFDIKAVIERSNEEIITALYLVENPPKKLKDLLTLWETLDEYSKQRHDVFDHLIIKLQSSPNKFYEWYLRAARLMNSQEIEKILLNSGPSVLKKIRDMALEDGGFRDRDLMADLLGLKKNGAGVIINNTQTTNTQNVIATPGLPKLLNRTNDIEDQLKQPAPLELTEGKQDYIEAEIITNKDEQECLIKKN